MSTCTHCENEIDADLLDKVMDILATGVKEYTFPCQKCNKPIVAINSNNMYYIKDEKGDQLIGAK